MNALEIVGFTMDPVEALVVAQFIVNCFMTILVVRSLRAMRFFRSEVGQLLYIMRHARCHDCPRPSKGYMVNRETRAIRLYCEDHDPRRPQKAPT